MEFALYKCKAALKQTKKYSGNAAGAFEMCIYYLHYIYIRFIVVYIYICAIIYLPDCCAGLPNVPKPALYAWGASSPPPKYVEIEFV